jgi:predicted phage-related endonuclease
LGLIDQFMKHLVPFGCATEELNRRCFERRTGHSIGAVQRCVSHPKLEWMGATLDGLVPDTGAVFEAKFMRAWNFAEDVAADKHMVQLQHNMLVARRPPRLRLNPDGGAKWVSIEVEADPRTRPSRRPTTFVPSGGRAAARALLLITEKRLR